MRRVCIAIFATVLSPHPSLYSQQPEPIGDNLLRLEGSDQPTSIHYQKLILLLKPPDAPASLTPENLPRFTMECDEKSGHRSLHWLLRFDGSPDFAFAPPPQPTPQEPLPKPNPSTNLKMRFEGYIHSGEFKRQWEILPTGEFQYRNPGMGSSNLDDPRHFMQWLTSLPNLRISYAKPIPGQTRELVFPAKPLLDEIKKENFCQP